MDDVDEALTALAIRAGLEDLGHYEEVVYADDRERAEQLARIARAMIEVQPIEISAIPLDDHTVRICITST